MSPELALIVRAALLVLAVVTVERFVARRRARLAEQRRAVVRLPMVLNPVVQPLHGRPLEMSVVRLLHKSVVVVPHNVVKLESQPEPSYLSEKRAA